MQNQVSKIRGVPVRYTTDVLVAGGGMAGVCAATAAAEMGASVILLEPNGKCGGNFTSSLVASFCAYHTILNGEETLICSGLGERVLSQLVKRNSLGKPIYHYRSIVPYIPFDVPALIGVLDEILIKAGVKVLFHQLAYDVVMENNRVQSVIVTEKGEQYAIECKTIIDCTGDGDVAFKAGVPVLSDGEHLQFPSLVFHLSGVNSDEALKITKKDLEELLTKAKQAGEYDFPRLDGTLVPLPREGMAHANMTLLKIGNRPVNALSSEDISFGQIEGRRQAFMYTDFLRKHVPGYENAYISRFPDFIGVRETRRIKGCYVLTKDDFMAARKFKDGIACCSWPLELHRADSTDWVNLPEGEYLEVPLRCLVSEEVENLFFAGRCLSADQEAHAAVRCGPSCMSMGEAVGIGAAKLSKDGGKARDLDGAAIRKIMQERGAHFLKEAY